MRKLAIVTDSTADLAKEYVDKNNIYVVPLYVIVDNKYYKDGIEITTDDINNLNESQSDFIGRTSAPSPGDFEEVFKKIKEDGYEKALYISLTPKLSATLSSAKLAETEGLDITYVDSGSLSLPQGLLVVHAVNLINEGYDSDEVIEKIKKNVGNQKLYGWLSTLRNLKASGRLGAAATKITTILNLKPIIVVDGFAGINILKIKTSREKSYKQIEKEIRNDLKDCNNYYIAYAYGGEKSFIDPIRDALTDIEAKASQVVVSQLGSVISTQAGPKSYAVCILKIE